MFSSLLQTHSLEMGLMIRQMTKRTKLPDQYINVIVEEADEGRADKIAQRIYGSTDYLWIVNKFASQQSMDGLLVAGMQFKLPSIPNIMKAMERERVEAIPVFEFIADPQMIQTLTVQAPSTGTINAPSVFEAYTTVTLIAGQPISLNTVGEIIFSVNDGVNYRVVGMALENAAQGTTAKYVTTGELIINNWAMVRDDGNGAAPDTNTILWLSEASAGKLSVVPPQTAGKHAVRVATQRGGNTVYVDVGIPLQI